MDVAVHTALVGAGATATMDLWAIVARRAFSLPSSNWSLVGRWIAHSARGRFRHDDIAKAEAVRGERALGWLAHYGVGIAFAALLVAVVGARWLAAPTIIPAILAGLCSLVAPFFLMQPAMGSGIAGSRTPKPAAARLRSVANHVVFGFGLYLAAIVLTVATG